MGRVGELSRSTSTSSTTRRYALDVAAQLAHGSLRFEVIRERGARNEDATADDIAEMRRLVAEAIAAGAVGFLDLANDLPPVDQR